MGVFFFRKVRVTLFIRIIVIIKFINCISIFMSDFVRGGVVGKERNKKINKVKFIVKEGDM